MRIGLVVLAVAHSEQAGAGWNICPSNADQESPLGLGLMGCYEQDAEWVDGDSDVECHLKNKDCLIVECTNNKRIHASFRSDLFQTNDHNSGSFIEQLQAGVAFLSHSNKGTPVHGTQVPLNGKCGYTIAGNYIKIDWDYNECEQYISIVDHGDKIGYVARMWANDQDRFTHDKIEMYVDTSVEAECTFDTRIEIDADGFWMNQENVEALNESFGSLADEFTCEFYSDKDYLNKITASSIVNMGERIYGKVTSTEFSGLSFDLVDVIVMNANECDDFDNCDEDNLFKVVDDGQGDADLDAKSPDGFSHEMGEDIEFNYLSFGFADNTGKNQNQVKIRCVVDVVLDKDAQ